MTRHIAVAMLILAAPLCAQTPDTINPEIARLRKDVDDITHRQPFDYSAYTRIIESARSRIVQLIAEDALRTPADFYAASVLSDDPGGFYEYRRVQHELALVALVLGHPDAMKRVSLTWDGLNWSWGRGQRIGSYKRDGVAMNMDPVPAPASVAAVFNDVATARRRAQSATDNAELQKLRDADQADREGAVNQAMMERINKNDPTRRARVLAMVDSGTLVSSHDFGNAALVLQHGHGVDDFRLAHELSIAAVALGDTSTIWLLSRTYDRLLLNLGHRQRLNTQYGGAESKLLPLDTTAVNDRIRKALGARSLKDATAAKI